MKKRIAVVCLLSLALAAAAFADGTDPFVFDISPRLLGADVGIGYTGLALVPGSQTTIWAYGGGGYEWMDYYRDASGALVAPGALAVGGALEGRDARFIRIEGAWRLGMEQGFSWNPRTKTNLLAAFLYYRGRLSTFQASPAQLLYDSTLPDRNGMLLNSLQAGVAYDDLLFETRHKTKNGLSAEASVEWGPGFLFNNVTGNSNYIRMNATARGFLPLFDLSPEKPSNVLSLYAGDRLSFDFAAGFGGTPVPIAVRQTFGGRDQFTGLGHAVRGVDSEGFDTNLKAVNNLELRLNLPALFIPDLVAGLVAYLDAGYYAQTGEGLAAAPSGFVASTGAGVSIDVLDLASLAAYVNYRLDRPNADGMQFHWSIEFGMHF